MGMRLRVMPGVSLGVSSRGVRASVGPRIGSIHVGTGRSAVSSGLGPISVGTSFGGGRPRGNYYARDFKRLEAQARRAEKERRWDEVRQRRQELLGVVNQTFSRAQPPPPASLPARPKVKFVLKQMAIEVEDVRASLPRGQRAGVTRALREVVEERAAAEHRAAVARARAAHAERLLAWRRLLANEPEDVVVALDAAFEDNASPAFPIDVQGDMVVVVMLVPGPSVFGEQDATITDAGNISLKKLSQRRRHEMYDNLVTGHSVATAREAFAVAPGLQEVLVVSVRTDTREPICLASMTEAGVGDPTLPPPSTVEFEALLYETTGRTKAPCALTEDDVPGIAAVLSQLRDVPQ